MKITKDNRHLIAEGMEKLKAEISNNDILHFNYRTKTKGDNKLVSIDFLIQRTDQPTE